MACGILVLVLFLIRQLFSRDFITYTCVYWWLNHSHVINCLHPRCTFLWFIWFSGVLITCACTSYNIPLAHAQQDIISSLLLSACIHARSRLVSILLNSFIPILPRTLKLKCRREQYALVHMCQKHMVVGLFEFVVCLWRVCVCAHWHKFCQISLLLSVMVQWFSELAPRHPAR